MYSFFLFPAISYIYWCAFVHLALISCNTLLEGKYVYIYILSWFSSTNINDSQNIIGRGGYLFNSSLLFPPASQTLRQ